MTPDEAPTATEQPVPTRRPTPERYALVVVLVAYFIAQGNAALHNGSYGQDFGWHNEQIVQAGKDPVQFICNTYQDGHTNPPLYYLLCGLVFLLTKGIHHLTVIALLQAALNTGAFALFYRVLDQLICSTLLRLSCFVFILFIPFSRTVTVVRAADGLAIPVFLIALYFFGRLVQARSLREYVVANSGVTLFLLLGVFTKYMFLSVAVAAAFGLLVLLRVGILSRWQALASLATVGLIPAACGVAEYRLCLQNDHFGVSRSWVDPFNSPYMNVRSIVWPRRQDTHVLAAPPYMEPADPAQVREIDRSTEGEKYNLLMRNKHSYPALLHLAVFTDILNVFQYDRAHLWITTGHWVTRNKTNQKRMSLAVKTGLLFSLGAVIAVPLMFWRGLQSTIVGGNPRWALLVVMLLMSWAWFANIVVFFPFIPGVYGHGYWLPRLVAPALLVFLVVSFVWVDVALAKRSRVASWVCLGAVLLQSGLHFSFLWPWGVC